jgi:hypothetical protein
LNQPFIAYNPFFYGGMLVQVYDFFAKTEEKAAMNLLNGESNKAGKEASLEIEDKPMTRMREEPISQSSALLSPPSEAAWTQGKGRPPAPSLLLPNRLAVPLWIVAQRTKVCLLAGEGMKRAGNRLLFS